MIRGLVLVAALLWAPLAAAQAVGCRNITFRDQDYSICEVDAAQADLRLFLHDEGGAIFGQFGAVDHALRQQGKRLAFAMNAGMYHRDRAPVGQYIEDGVELKQVVPNAGPGNFGMLPNGVFCIRPGRADVFETLDYLKRAPACSFATQSGPMLLIEGRLHPRFLPDSTSRYVRNGVGTSADGTRAVFAISQGRVTFYEFASLFRDSLKLPNALYFDGNISRLYAPDLRRSDTGFALGPIVGVVVPQTN